MKTIYKYELDTNQVSAIIKMPRYSEALSVQWMNGAVYVWALVNTAEPMESTQFRIFATGEPFDLDEWADYDNPSVYRAYGYVGTVQVPASGRTEVYHIFYLSEVTVGMEQFDGKPQLTAQVQTNPN